ncbi:MAG: hypothetical protein DLM68_05955 [Hyphomicrobiales bacterium]|nr:MAG: hypothetical protein DLM68_05955 [Hyphomicrobiales bacterium]
MLLGRDGGRSLEMTVFFYSAAGSAQGCWRSSGGNSGAAQDFWLADGKAQSRFKPEFPRRSINPKGLEGDSIIWRAIQL